MRMHRVLASALTGVAVALIPLGAMAHSERPAANPPDNPSVQVPTHRAIDGADTSILVVCKPESAGIINSWAAGWDYLKARDNALLSRCAFHDLQAAVDAVQHSGTTIAVLPGTYYEEPSKAAPGGVCDVLLANVATNARLSYAQQLACPHVTQLVAILGDPDAPARGVVDGNGGYDCDGRLCNLQVEGMGIDPLDVVFDAKFSRLNMIRADRADGVYFRNFTVEHTEFNGMYVIETDGYAFDSILARWDLEYGFLSFTVDHGLWVNCETYGNGDSGLYPGGQAQRFGYRPSVEVKGCSTHHNAGGTSGTAGDSVYFHDNLMYDNVTGIANDSFAAHHPGVPQNSALYTNNKVFSNNEDFYYYVRTMDPKHNDGHTYCDRPTAQVDYEGGVVCPSLTFPTGVGILTAGGNFNVFAHNWIYDNWRMGTMLFQVLATFRDDQDPSHLTDNSHGNRYYNNSMGFGPDGTPGGAIHPNGLDFWWDESGVLNCWQENKAAPGHQLYSDPPYDTTTAPGNPPYRKSIGGRPPDGQPKTGRELPLCHPLEQPKANDTAASSKVAFLASCATYSLHPNLLAVPPQSSDPPGCPMIAAPPYPPDGVPTGFGPAKGQEVGPAPSGWSLGCVNCPQGAATRRPFAIVPNLTLPNTRAVVPVGGLLLLVAFFAGLRVGQVWLRRRRPGSAG